MNAIRAALSLLFAVSGAAKLFGHSAVRKNFRRWGHPDPLMYFIGACEAAGAAALWLPRLELPAALGLTLLMFGALGTHLKAKDGPAQWLPAVVALGLLSALLIR